MKNTDRIRLSLGCIVLLLLCLLSACTPIPDHAAIEAAIRESLSREASPPALEFARMEVPMRSAGKAHAVLWTADGAIQRNYTLEHNSSLRRFLVTGFTTSMLGADGIYRLQQPAPLTQYAARFGFTDDVGERVRLIYIGRRDGAADIRAQHEAVAFSDLTAEQLAEFERCDLGGDTLVLLVPKYQGTVLSITEVKTMGDALVQGDTIQRFEEGAPIYLWYDWDGAYDIGITLCESGGFLRGYEDVLDQCKKYEDGLIY